MKTKMRHLFFFALAFFLTTSISAAVDIPEINTEFRNYSETAQFNPSEYGIYIKAPDIAENGAVVPVSVKAFGMNGEDRYLKEVRIYTCEMVHPIARFTFANKTSNYVATRIKMRRSNYIIALGILNNDEVVFDKKYIKNTIGGCGGGGSGESPDFAGLNVKSYERSTSAATTWVRSSLPENSVRFKMDEYELPVTDYRADVKIEGFRVRVLLDISFHNNTHWQREGFFNIRLPDNASPYYVAYGDVELVNDYESAPEKLSMRVKTNTGFSAEQLDYRRHTIASSLKEGIMVPKQQARNAYQTTVGRRIDPALVEWQGSGIFSVRVFPIQPNKTHRVLLGYEFNLKQTGEGLLGYQFTAPGNAKRTQVYLHVHPQNREHLKSFSQHSSLKKENNIYAFNLDKNEKIHFLFQDFNNLIMTGDDAAGDYFAARFSPTLKLSKSKPGSPYAIIAIDTSLSSQPQSFNEYVQLTEHLLMQNQDNIQYFAVMLFDVGTSWWKLSFVKNTQANRDQLVGFLYRQSLSGATDLNRAVTEFSRPEKLNADTIKHWDVFLLSDGKNTWGRNNLKDMFDKIRHSKIRTLNAYVTRDQGVNLKSLNALSELTGGAVFATSPEQDMKQIAIAHRFDSWHLEGVEVPGTKDVLSTDSSSTLYQHQPLIISGRGKPESNKVILHLRRGTQTHKLEQLLPAKIKSGLTARIFGENAVRHIEEQTKFDPQKALAFAGHFRVPRKSMSLLMLENQQEYDRFKVKTHINYTAKVREIILHDSSIAKVTHSSRNRTVYTDFTDNANADLGSLIMSLRTDCKAWSHLTWLYEQIRETRLTIDQGPLHLSEKERRHNLSNQIPLYDLDAAQSFIENQLTDTDINPSERVRILSTLIELAPDDPKLLADTSQHLISLKFNDDAYYLWRRLFDLAPYHNNINTGLARLFESYNKKQSADYIRHLDGMRLSQ